VNRTLRIAAVDVAIGRTAPTGPVQAGLESARQPSFRCERRMALTCLIDFVLLTNCPSARIG
jgi:hypothetical protein